MVYTSYICTIFIFILHYEVVFLGGYALVFIFSQSTQIYNVVNALFACHFYTYFGFLGRKSTDTRKYQTFQ